MKAIFYDGNELYHHGILGQRWGVRRYQNADGTLTEAGKKRYGTGSMDHDRNLNKNLEYRLSKGRSKGSVEESNELSDKLRKKTGTKSSALTAKQTAITAVSIFGPTLAAIAVNAALSNQSNVSTGQSYVNSYLKSSGTKKVSSTKNTEKTWADYAWEEIEKS